MKKRLNEFVILNTLRKQYSLIIISVIFLISSCAGVKPIKTPATIEELMQKYSKVTTITGLGDGTMKTPEKSFEGTVTINVDKDDLMVKVYSMGFLAGSLSSHNQIVQSNMSIHPEAKDIIAQGIIDGLLWWNIDDFVITEKDGFYIIEGMDKTLTINKITMLPVKMKLRLKHGDSMDITYNDEIRVDDYLFPKEIIATFDGYYVKCVFDSMKILNIGLSK
ncbi:MAG: hypothetical protein HQK91_11310 [Nitrospirae bacterium]|nr:hypothetical protein [Nitrospirota bacterium]MBF0542023.1 hypothetical protein [Nitrospirota bacterium]